MIEIKKSETKLSAVSIYESLLSRNYIMNKETISEENWREFTSFIGLDDLKTPENKGDAINVINQYLNKSGIEAQHKVSEFFEWSNFDNIQRDLDHAQEILEDAASNSAIIKLITNNRTTNNNKIKKAELINGWFIVAIYDEKYEIESVHISTEKSHHKTEKGLHDFAEVGYFKDKVCVNLDTHSYYNDINGYNDYYDIYITNEKYDFSEYRKLAEQIFYYTK